MSGRKMEFCQAASENDRPLLGLAAHLCLPAGLHGLRVKRPRLKERRKHPETDTPQNTTCSHIYAVFALRCS